MIDARRAQTRPAQLPLIIAMDEDLVSQWGGPPWTTEQWSTLAAALARYDLHAPTFVGPTRFLVSPSEPSAVAPGVPPIQLVPTALATGEGEPIRFASGALGAPFAVLEEALLLTPDANGVLLQQSVSGDAGSLWCAWVAGCQGGERQHIQLPRHLEVPRISASELLDEDIRLVVDEGSTILLGVTVPELSPSVIVGPGHIPMSLVDAVGWSVTAGRTLGLMRRPTPLMVGGGLVGVLMTSWLLFWLSSGRIRQGFILWAPLATLVLSAVVHASRWVMPPITAAVLVSVLPALVVLLLGRGMFFSFLRGLDRRLLRIRQSAPFQMRPIHTHDQLLIKLGGLTRVYMHTSRCAWFVLEPGGSLRFFGGYGVTAEQLRRMPSHPGTRRRRAIPSIDDPMLFVDEEVSAVLVPLYEQEQLLGLWCIPRRSDEERPDPGILNSVLRWLEPRLVFQGNLRRRDILDFRAEILLDRMDRLVREHHFQLGTVQSLGLPLMIADISGEIQHANEALRGLLGRLEQPPFMTIRGLLYHLAAEEVEAHTARLYRLQEPVLLTWAPKDGVHIRLHLQPILRSEGEQRELLGFSVLFIEAGEQSWATGEHNEVLAGQLAQALQQSQKGLHKIRKGLGMLTRPVELRAVLEQSLDEVEAQHDAMEKMSALLVEPSGNRAQLVDPIALIQRALDETRPLQSQRQISSEFVFQDETSAVWIPTHTARIALLQFFRYALRHTPEGGWLEVRLTQEADDQQFVEVKTSGGPLDPYSVQQIISQKPQNLDPRLGAFSAMKEVFGDLELGGEGPMGLRIRFALPRG